MYVARKMEWSGSKEAKTAVYKAATTKRERRPDKRRRPTLAHRFARAPGQRRHQIQREREKEAGQKDGEVGENGVLRHEMLRGQRQGQA